MSRSTLAVVLLALVVCGAHADTRVEAPAKRLRGLAGDTSVCDQLGSSDAKFLCGMANAVWSSLFPGNDLLTCVEEGGIAIEDFYNAGKSLMSAGSSWHNGQHTTAIGQCKTALGDLHSGLSEFQSMLGNCKEMEKLAARIGGIVAKLNNVVGETVEVVEVLTKAEDVFTNAEGVINNWGSNWVQCGVDAANVICDASQLWGDGC